MAGSRRTPRVRILSPSRRGSRARAPRRRGAGGTRVPPNTPGARGGCWRWRIGRRDGWSDRAGRSPRGRGHGRGGFLLEAPPARARTLRPGRRQCAGFGAFSSSVDLPQKERGGAKTAAPPTSRCDARNYFLTSNSFVAATVPSAETSTLYLPAGQPDAFATWNSVTAGPVGAMSRDSSFTSVPFAPYVQRALSVAFGATP